MIMGVSPAQITVSLEATEELSSLERAQEASLVAEKPPCATAIPTATTNMAERAPLKTPKRVARRTNRATLDVKARKLIMEEKSKVSSS